MLQISQRPLTGSDADRRLFVGRSAEMGHLTRAAELGFNVLVLGERGSGITSLMHQHQRSLQDSNHPVHYARAPRTDRFADLITVIRIAVEGPRAPAFLGGENPSLGLYGGGDPDPPRYLRRLVTAETRSAPHKTTVILDEMHNAELVHELFGRHRDDMWQLPFRWVVCGLLTRSSDYLEPPADAFFDTTVTLGPLDDSAATELLDVRLALASADDSEAHRRIASDRSGIVKQGKGNPRRILAAARDTALRSTEESLLADSLLASAADLGNTERLALRYLLANGPSSPSDPQIIQELDVTRARVNHVLRRLEDAGLAFTFPDKGGVGRPRRMYATSLGSSEAGSVSNR